MSIQNPSKSLSAHQHKSYLLYKMFPEWNSINSVPLALVGITWSTRFMYFLLFAILSHISNDIVIPLKTGSKSLTPWVIPYVHTTEYIFVNIPCLKGKDTNSTLLCIIQMYISNCIIFCISLKNEIGTWSKEWSNLRHGCQWTCHWHEKFDMPEGKIA